MNTTYFLVIMSLVVISQIIVLLVSVRSVDTVKAGNVLKHSPATKLRIGSKPRKLLVGQDYVDVSALEQLVVCGNSMKDYQIHNGQCVFVSTFNYQDKFQIENHPVVVLAISNAGKFESKYKLRKMIAYAEGFDTDWHILFNNNRTRIKIDEATFVAKCAEKASKLRAAGVSDGKLILSETYDEDLGICRYSLHPAETLYGIVKYAV